MPENAEEEALRQLKKARADASGHGRDGDAAQLAGHHDRPAMVDQSKDNLNLKKAEKILDEDHYGLERVKERIIESLAVRKLQGKAERLDPLPRRTSGRRQDIARTLDRPCAGSQIRAAEPWRRP